MHRDGERSDGDAKVETISIHQEAWSEIEESWRCNLAIVLIWKAKSHLVDTGSNFRKTWMA